MTIFIGGKVRNLTVKFWKYCFSVMVYMRKLESTAGLVALLILLFSATSNAAEYYTWVDENGVVNYAEHNPQGYSAQHVSASQRFGYAGDAQNNPSETPPQVEDAASDPDQLDDKAIDAQIADEKARIDKEIASAKKSNCAIGKRNLAQLQAYARIKVKDDDGTERLLTDSEKNTRISKAKQTISENCTG